MPSIPDNDVFSIFFKLGSCKLLRFSILRSDKRSFDALDECTRHDTNPVVQ